MQARQDLARCMAMLRQLKQAALEHIQYLHAEMDEIQKVASFGATLLVFDPFMVGGRLGRGFSTECALCVLPQIMTPVQLARFYVWVEQNEWGMQVICCRV